MSSDAFKLLFIGVLVAGLLAPLLTSSIGPPSVVLNGESLSSISVRSGEEGLQVPLEPTARELGAQIKKTSEGYQLSWGGGDSTLIPASRLSSSGGRNYVSLEYLAEALEVDYRKSGERYYLRTQPAELRDAASSGNALLFKFDRLVPYEVQQDSSKTLKLTFYNLSDFDRPLPSFNSDLIDKVEKTSDSTHRVSLTITGKRDLQYKSSSRITPEGFRSLFVLGSSLSPPSSEELEPALPRPSGEDLQYKRRTEYFRGTSHTLSYVRISDWQDNYQLQVVTPSGGVGERASLHSLVSGTGGAAGINANFFDVSSGIPIGLVIKDGQLLSDNWGKRAALTVDKPGQLDFVRPSVELTLEGQHRTVTVDDVNRPVGSDEIVAYTDDYGGRTCKSSAGRTRAIRVRDERVVGNSTSTCYSSSSGYTIIATGNQASRLRPFEEGMEVDFRWELDSSTPAPQQAVSAGPLLVHRGKNVLDIDGENFTSSSDLVNSATDRSVLATTGQGDLLLMVVGNTGISLRELPSLLLSTDLDIETAIAFDGGQSAGIVFRDGAGLEQVGGKRDIPVGLALVPKASR
ncbi:MAG: phosphodiester glycosidase family protein [Candidatus Acetothermia bacterium]